MRYARSSKAQSWGTPRVQRRGKRRVHRDPRVGNAGGFRGGGAGPPRGGGAEGKKIRVWPTAIPGARRGRNRARRKFRCGCPRPAISASGLRRACAVAQGSAAGPSSQASGECRPSQVPPVSASGGSARRSSDLGATRPELSQAQRSCPRPPAVRPTSSVPSLPVVLRRCSQLRRLRPHIPPLLRAVPPVFPPTPSRRLSRPPPLPRAVPPIFAPTSPPPLPRTMPPIFAPRSPPASPPTSPPPGSAPIPPPRPSPASPQGAPLPRSVSPRPPPRHPRCSPGTRSVGPRSACWGVVGEGLCRPTPRRNHSRGGGGPGCPQVY